MKTTLTILLVLIFRISLANMASPYVHGTFVGSAFSSRDFEVSKEKIIIKLSKNLGSAFYVIEYYVKGENDGKQIPLLFIAQDYKDSFRIWVDDQPTRLLDIPPQYLKPGNSTLNGFSNLTSQQDQNEVLIKYNEQFEFKSKLSDLKYFEVNLSKGEHKIRVEYVAKAWIYRGNWVKRYNFYYSLTPIKYWKSFGELEVVIDATMVGKGLETNINRPYQGKMDSIAIWKLNQLPSDFLEITFNPQINNLAKSMILVGPFGITILFSIIFIALHIVWIWKFRRNNPLDEGSIVVLFGSYIFPFLILVSNIFSYSIIDTSIGTEAGKHHGYVFLVIFLYPLFMPIYWLIMWLIDKLVKRKINNAL